MREELALPLMQCEATRLLFRKKRLERQYTIWLSSTRDGLLTIRACSYNP